MQIPAESVLQCKRQFVRSGQISEFHIFAPPNAAPYTVPPGAHALLRPPPAATEESSLLAVRLLIIFIVVYFMPMI